MVWGALDPQSDVLYLYSEYSAEADPPMHAAAIRSRGDWIVGLVDPTAHGRKHEDGYRLMERYASLGLRMEWVRNPLEAGILSGWERMNTGRLKVFSSLTKYFHGRRLYRRDESNQVISDQDGLQDALRCLINGISHMSTKPEPPERQPSRRYQGALGWAR